MSLAVLRIHFILTILTANTFNIICASTSDPTSAPTFNTFIYIVDQYNHRIQRWTDGSVGGETVAGGNGPGSLNDQFYLPYSLFVDSSASIYIADTGNHRIQKWDAGANYASTVAGTSEVAGLGSSELNNPNGVFIDSVGSIYVADTNNNRVQKWIDGATQGVTVAGDSSGIPGNKTNELYNPFGVWVDKLYSIYVVDTNNNRIQKWIAGATEGVTVAGDSSGVKGSAFGQLANPYGLCVDLSDNVYVADFGNDRVVKWTPGATQGVVVAGGNGYGAALNQFRNPTGVFVDSAGNIYVTDQSNFRIMKWIAGAAEGSVVAGDGIQGDGLSQLYYPSNCWVGAGIPTNFTYPTFAPTRTISPTQSLTAISYEPSYEPTSTYPTVAPTINNYIYVVDQYNNRIQRWADNATEGETVAGGNGQGGLNNQLNLPFGFFVDSSASIYIADTGNHRIQKWDAGANYASTVAGTSEVAGLGSSELNNPNGVFIDSVGSVYVADTNNNRIQKWFAGATEGATMAGNSSGVAGNSSHELNNPFALWINSLGNIYISDTKNHRVQKWVAGATQGVTVAGDSGGKRGSTVNKLDNPYGLCLDISAGNVYVADFNNDRIVKWTPGATHGVVVAGGNGNGDALNQLNNPTGVFVDLLGNIYVTDQSNYRIMKWIAGAAEGSVVAGDGTQGDGLSQLLFPSNCWVGTGIPAYPTMAPSQPTKRPSKRPTKQPSILIRIPSRKPSRIPTLQPTSIVSTLMINQQFLNISCSVCQSADGKAVMKKSVSDTTNCPINTIVILSVVCPSSVASSLTYKSKYHRSLDSQRSPLKINSKLNGLQINYKILLDATQNSTTILQLLSNALKSGDFTRYLKQNALLFQIQSNFSNVISIESFTSSLIIAITSSPQVSSAANGSTTNIGLIAGVVIAVAIIVLVVIYICFFRNRKSTQINSEVIPTSAVFTSSVILKSLSSRQEDTIKIDEIYSPVTGRENEENDKERERERDSQINIYSDRSSFNFGVVSEDVSRQSLY